jgi:hypothetical protein
MRPLAGAAILLMLFAGTALAAAAGTVVGLSGACFVVSAGNRSVLALGASVQESDTVEVAADGKLKLRMSDGSVISVAPGTTVTITTYAVNDSGQRQDAVLSLGQGSAAVRSTDWFIETTPQADQVTVLSGSVSVTSAATGRSIIVPPHRGTRLALGHDPLPPRALSRASLSRVIGRTDWRPPRNERQPGRRAGPREMAPHHGQTQAHRAMRRDDGREIRRPPEFRGDKGSEALRGEKRGGAPAPGREGRYR